MSIKKKIEKEIKINEDIINSKPFDENNAHDNYLLGYLTGLRKTYEIIKKERIKK